MSSQIVLTHIPARYYRPENAYEQSALARFENISTNIFETIDEASLIVANEIATQIQEKKANGELFVLAVAGGNSPLPVLCELVRKHKEEGLSFSNVVFFNTYEFYPLVSLNFGSLACQKQMFLDHVDILAENIYSPNPMMAKEEIYNFCKAYENVIAAKGGIDYLILGIGFSGNIGFNTPGSSINASTRLVLLDAASRKEAATSFSASESVPTSAITMGVSTIMKAKKVVLMAWGDDKAAMILKTIEGKMSDAMPATYLQLHANAHVFLNLGAASSLTRISHPWLVTNCDWDNKLIRRAIAWLCMVTKKPILKLTNKDYSEHGLGELLALYGSAYNVNIKIFNDIQHTITGWPGGKPNADDTNRPERANPFPKKVIVFSPHPDDDVISMGGTLRRLIEQNHDVHVCYETSGNIAVGDEEVIRYVSYLRNVCDQYGTGSDEIAKKADEIKHFLLHEKVEGEPERSDVLFMKGTIRREEARTACRFMGVKDDHVHFLDLPFYETGLVKKNDLGEADMLIVKEILNTINPDQVFVAGDLADPHGTHKVCLDAILAAVDECKNEAWLKGCRFWMYRGAWAEWAIDDIEMAVPMSPEEVRLKRNAILKHQSQMESAPFLGDDERLFWQRAEDRNHATAELYKDLGLASYEAIEAFVEYHPL